MRGHVPPIRIVLAESRHILRDGLRNILAREADFEFVGETRDGRHVAKTLQETRPDVLLMPLSAPDFAGLEILRHLNGAHSKAAAIVLAGAEEREQVAAALASGARGIVFMDSDTKTLSQAIRSIVRDGKRWVGEQAIPAKGDGDPTDPAGRPKTGARARIFGLTERELEIVATVVSGKSNRQIAARFSISEDTVKHHLTNIFDKVGVYNRLELALFAIHHDLVGKR